MQKLQTVNAETLLYEPLEKPSFVVDSLIPTGLSLFCGSQKIGKSWLMLKLCLCVSQGIPLWDMPTMEGDVLYLCLEDTFCRIQDRLFRLTDEASGRLHFAVASDKLSDGLIVQLEDYLKEFHDFIDSNINEIAALNIVATRPKELTRQSLRELRLILERNHFSETMLQTAWKEMNNQEVAADIISFIRQRSMGDALVSKEERIHSAIVKTKAAHPELSKVQINWLERIEAYLLREVVLNKESFEAPQFKIKGGYAAVNKAFANKLDAVIDEINSHMYTA